MSIMYSVAKVDCGLEVGMLHPANRKVMNKGQSTYLGFVGEGFDPTVIKMGTLGRQSVAIPASLLENAEHDS